jgi:basic amino acid/polyamine antiporter, APA family
MTSSPLHRPGWNGTAKLEPGLRLFDACALVAGTVIGPGIFFVPAALAAQIETPGLLLLAWVCGTALSLLGALCLAELATAFPSAGGPYVYLKSSFGAVTGFLYGWALVSIVQPGSIAVLALVAGEALGSVFGFGSAGRSCTAVAAILLLTFLNCLGLRKGKVVQNQFALLKTAGILVLVVLLFAGSFAAGGSKPSAAVSVPHWSGFGIGLVAILWALEGWQVLSFVAAEVERPERNLPQALFAGTGVAAVLFILVSLACVAALPPNELRAEGSAAAAAATALYGMPGRGFVTVLTLLAALGAMNGLILSGPRVYYAMAADGLFFRPFGHLHYRYRVPVPGLVVQGIWAALIALTGALQTLFTYVVFTLWIFYGAAAVAVIVLRRREPLLQRPFRTPGYPWAPGLFAAAAAAMAVYAVASYPLHAMVGIAFVLVGIPLYMWFEHY